MVIQSERNVRVTDFVMILMLTGLGIWFASMWKIAVNMGFFDIIVLGVWLMVMAAIDFGLICRYISTGKKVLMNQEGCIISFWIWKKQYNWDYFKVKQLEHYYEGYDCVPLTPYKEGAVFSAYPIRRSKKHKILDDRTIITRHVFSMVLVAFKTEMTEEEKNMRNMMWGVCEVDKEEFLQKMEEWGVELEKPE